VNYVAIGVVLAIACALAGVRQASSNSSYRLRIAVVFAAVAVAALAAVGLTR
jgi:hypothetical protein